MDKLTGIHAVKEALEAQRPIEHIVIAKGRQDTRIEEIVQLARKKSIPVRFEDRSQLDRLANSKDHQGVVALAAVFETQDRKSTRLNSSHVSTSYAVF